MQVQVIKNPLPYDGRTYAVGDTVEMTPAHGKLFVVLGKVTAGEGVAEQRPKRRYRRRDMRAEA